MSPCGELERAGGGREEREETIAEPDAGDGFATAGLDDDAQGVIESVGENSRHRIADALGELGRADEVREQDDGHRRGWRGPRRRQRAVQLRDQGGRGRRERDQAESGRSLGHPARSVSGGGQITGAGEGAGQVEPGSYGLGLGADRLRKVLRLDEARAGVLEAAVRERRESAETREEQEESVGQEHPGLGAPIECPLEGFQGNRTGAGLGEPDEDSGDRDGTDPHGPVPQRGHDPRGQSNRAALERVGQQLDDFHDHAGRSVVIGCDAHPPTHERVPCARGVAGGEA